MQNLADITRRSLSSLVAVSLITQLTLPQLKAQDSGLDAAFVSTISPGLTPDSYVPPPAAANFTSGTGAVNAVALQSDGKIIAGGNISRFQAPPAGSPMSALKRILSTGVFDTAFNSGGAGLAASSGQPEVNALLTDSADRIYVGGTFASYNGTARSGILRLLADGSLDPDYAPTGLTGSVRYAQALALQADNKLLVGGGYTSINGTFRKHLARLLTTGALDTSFDPNVALSLATSVRSVALQPDGKIIVAGTNALGSFDTAPLLVRLNADGTLDASFSAALTPVTGAVSKVVVLPDGRIAATGFLTLAPSGNEVDLAVFLPDGSLDTAFQAALGSGPNGSVLDLLLQPDGTLLAAGVFNLWNGQPRASIARLALDGTLDAELAPAPYTTNRDNPNVEPFYLSHFYSLALQPDGKIVVGGWFSRVTDPEVETYNLTRFVNAFSASSSGSIRLLSPTATTAENAGSITLQVSRFGGLTGAVSVQYATSAGTASAGTDFTATNGTLSWASGEGGFKNITITLPQDTAAEAAETFTVTLSSPTGGATLPPAKAQTLVTIRDDDSAPIITRNPNPVTTEQGSRVSFFVRYDSVLTASVQWQRDPDGLGTGAAFADIPGAMGLEYVIPSSDPALHNGHYRAIVSSTAGSTPSAPAELFVTVPTGSVVTTTSTVSLSGTILNAALDATERPVIIAATGISATPAELRRIRRNPSNFSQLQTDPTFTVSTFNNATGPLLILPDGRILVGGFFNQVNGTARLALARFNADGAFDSAYAPALPTTSAALYTQALALGTGGKYYVGFGSGGGLRRYQADGSADTAFNTNTAALGLGTTNNSAVNAILEAPDGKIYISHRISGTFSTSYPIWRLNADGTRDLSFADPAPNQEANVLALLPDGRLAVAGRFQGFGSPLSAHNRVGLINPNGTLDAGFHRNPAVDGSVTTLRYREGRLLIAGEFANVGGTALRGIARLNLDGTRDETFSIGVGIAGNFNSRVNAALFTGSGDIFIAGDFLTVKGVARDRIAYLVGNPLIGSIGFDSSFARVPENAASVSLTLRRYGPATEAVSIRYSTADGILSDVSATAGTDYTATTNIASWAAGDLTEKSISIPLLDDAVSEPTKRFRVVLSEPSGPISPAAAATVEILDSDTPAVFSVQPTAPALLTAGGTLTLTGTATSSSTISYQWLRNGIAIPGATSASFTKTGLTLADAGLYTLVATNLSGPAFSQSVQVIIQPQAGRIVSGQATTGRPSFAFGAGPTTIATLPDGGALLGGSFTLDITANRHQSYLLRINPDGSSIDTSVLTLNGGVVKLIRQPDGKIVVGGNFTTVNGAAQRYLARLNADCTPDTDFNTAVASAITTSIGSLSSLAIDSTGRIYAGFNSTTGSIRRVSSTGANDSAYVISTNGGGVTALGMDANNQLIVGGNFTSIQPSGQTSVSKNRIARLTSLDTVDTAFSPAVGGNFSIADILVTPTGRIFVAGGTGGGNSNLVEVNQDGSATVFSLGSGNQVYQIAFGPEGRLAVARASINGAGSISRLILPATIGAQATADTTFNVGTGPDADVRSLAYLPNGSLWIAGNFNNFNGTSTGGVVLLQGSPSDPSIVNPPARADVNAGGTAQLAVGAVGTGLSYQWSKNGVELVGDARISGVTSAILTITGLTVADDDLYTVAVTGGTPATTLISPAVKINVLGAPIVAASPPSVMPALGGTITLAADVLAATPATYVWRRNGVLIQNGGRYSGANTGTLVIANANNADNGDYTLTVTNGLGQISTTPANVAVNQIAHVRDASLIALGVSNAGSTTNVVNALLHLPDGRTLIGGNGSFVGAATTQANAPLVVIGTNGQASVIAAGALNASVFALHMQADGKILVGGTFTTINGQSGVGRTRIARLNADLTLDTTFVAVGASDTVARIVTDALGRIYIQGSFFNYEGQTGYSNFVRLNPDGALDRSFNPSLSSGIQAMRVQSDGKLLLAGNLVSHLLGGNLTNINGIVRLLPSGAVDTSFTPTLPTFSSLSAMDIDATGKIYIAGTANSAGYFIRRLHADGTTDSGFTFAETLNSSPFTLVVQSTGKVLLGGNFTTPRNRFLRLNSDGSLDTGFDVGTGFTHTTGSPSVNAIALDSQGRIWVGGSRFTKYNDGTTPANGIAVLQGDGPVLTFTQHPAGQIRDLGSTVTFSAAAAGNNGFTYQWRKNGVPLANGGRISGATTATLSIANLMLTDADNYTVVVTSPSLSLTSNIASLEVLSTPEILTNPVPLTLDFGATAVFSGSARGAGSLSYRWLRFDVPLTDGPGISGAATPTLTLTNVDFADAGNYSLRVTNNLGSSTTTVANLTVQRRPGGFSSAVPITSAGQVYALLKLPDGSILVGGNFNSLTINGTSIPRSRIARFLADGSLDPNFNPTFNNDVRSLARDAAGRIFVGGNFTSVIFGGTTTACTRVVRLTSSLALDTSFSTASAGPSGVVNALAADETGGVYAGGNFTSFGGTTGMNHLVRLSPTGERVTTFTSPTNNTVFGLLRRTDGQIYVGGIGGTQLAAANGVKNTNFSAAAPTNLGLQAEKFRILADGSLLVSGNGANPQGYLRRLNANTGENIANYSSLHSNKVVGIAVQADGKIVSGSITGFARFDLTGTADAGFSAFNNTVNDIVVDDSGRIWVGGSFNAYGSTLVSGLAVLNGGELDVRDGLLPPQTITFNALADRPFNAATNSFTLSAAASSSLPVSFSVSGPATISGNTVTLTGVGLVTVTANQAGNDSFAAAPPVVRTFTVTKGNQTINFNALANRPAGSAPFTLSATASSGLTVSYQVTGPASVSGSTLTLNGTPGTVVVRAIQNGNDHYNAATEVERSFEATNAPVVQVAQTITFNAPLSLFRSEGPITLIATSSSGLPVTLTVISGPGSISGNLLTFSGVGAIKVRATQAGNANFKVATAVEKTINVKTDPVALTLLNLSQVYTSTPRPITTLGGSGPVTITYKVGPTYVSTPPINVGTYPVKAVSGTVTKTGSLIITKAPLQVIPDNQRKFAGQPNPTPLTFSYSGFLGSDNSGNSVSKAPTISTTAALASSGGFYPITATGGTSANYAFVYQKGVMTVESFAGLYEVLLKAGSPLRPVAKLELTVAASSKAFTGKLTTPKETAPISLTGSLITSPGAETASGSATVKKGTNTYLVTFTLPLSGDFEATASVNTVPFATATDGKKTLILTTGQVLTYVGTHTAVLDLAVPLTTSLPFPEGTGHALVTIDAKGVLKMAGKLADGTGFTASLPADNSTDPGYRLFAQPYLPARTESYVGGFFSLTPHPDLTGRRLVKFSDAQNLVWAKAARTLDTSYRAGFGILETRLTLDPWQAPAPKKGAILAITLADRLGLTGPANAFAVQHSSTGSISQGSLPTSLTLNASTNAVTVTAPVTTPANVTKWKTTLTPATGALTGSFVVTDTVAAPTTANPSATKAVTRTVNFTGVLRQPPSTDLDGLIGSGHFLLPALPGALPNEIRSGEIRFELP